VRPYLKSNQHARHWWLTLVILIPSYLGGLDRFKASPGKQFARAHLQINQGIKWTGGVVERLPSKCEALSSNSSPTKKEKKLTRSEGSFVQSPI
jgi:hypothetical protein